MKTAATTPTVTDTPMTGQPAPGQGAPGRRPPVHRRLPVVIAVAMFTGLLTTLVLVLVVFAGAPESAVTGSALLGMAAGWAILALLTTRLTSSPQRWAAVPAVAMAAIDTVLIATRPGDGALTAAGWIWPPLALALAAWRCGPCATPCPADRDGCCTR